MTKEEIIRNLKYTMEKHKNDIVNTFGTNISVMCKDILDYLEQEPIIDKIRAEITEKKQKINFKGLGDYEKAQVEMRLLTLNEILQIIDKYKTESEE